MSTNHEQNKDSIPQVLLGVFVVSLIVFGGGTLVYSLFGDTMESLSKAMGIFCLVIMYVLGIPALIISAIHTGKR